jgi:hypothetical protein
MSYTDGAPEPPPPEQGIDWTSPKYGGQPAAAEAGGAIDWTSPKYGGQPIPESYAATAAKDIGQGAASGLVRGSIGLATAPTGLGANTGASLARRYLPESIAPYAEEAIGAVTAPAAYGAKKGAEFATYLRPELAPYTKPLTEAPADPSNPPLVQAAEAGAHAALPSFADPYYQPTTFPGKVAQTGGAMAPYLLIPGGEGASLLRRAGTEVAAPAVGSEVLKTSPVGKAYPEFASLGGALLGGTLGEAGLSAASGIAERYRPVASPEVMAATEKLGMPALPRFAAAENLAPGTAKFAASVPLAGGAMRSAADRAQANIEQAGTNVFEQAGAKSPYEAGADVATSYGNWQKELSDAAEANYKKVTDALPAGSEIVTSPISATQQAAADITARNAASAAGPGPAVGAVQSALDMGNMGYQGMRDLRTRLRQQGDAAGLTPTERSQYKTLQDAVTDDINTHLDRLDPSGNAKSALDTADQTYRSDQGRLQAVGRRLGIDNPSVSNEQYLDKISSMATGKKEDIDTLQQAMGALPQKMRDQTAGSIAKDWWTDANGNVAPDQFFKKYNAMTPEGKDALFGKSGSGGLRDSYDALSAVSQRYKNLGDIATKTGGPQTTGMHLADIAGEVGAGALAGHGYGPEIFAGILGKAGAEAALPLLLSRPAVAASAARLERARQGYSLTRLGGQATAGASRIVAGAANDFAQQANAAGGNVDADELTRQITGQ